MAATHRNRQIPAITIEVLNRDPDSITFRLVTDDDGRPVTGCRAVGTQYWADGRAWIPDAFDAAMDAPQSASVGLFNRTYEPIA
jgi:hypothetical protein